MKRMMLDMHGRQEIVKANCHAYERTTRKGRKEILDRLEPATGMSRSCLATVLGNYGRKAAGEGTERKGRRKERPERKRGGRPREHREDFTAALRAIHLGGLRASVREAVGSDDRGDARLSGGGH